MSADVLREAASLMRERAQAARAGRWILLPSTTTPDGMLIAAEWEADLRRVAITSGSLPEGNVANAEHIASWHPGVALPIADLLDRVADDYAIAQYGYWSACALAVARAYLNT